MSVTARVSSSFLRPVGYSNKFCRLEAMPLRAKVTDPRFTRIHRNMSATSSSGKPSEVTVEDDVIFQQQMGNRTILLNRPKKLNSLDLSMIRKILQRLKTWEKSDLSTTIVMKGAGEKAFCAGGDVTALVTMKATGGELQRARENYFRHEYTLDYYLSTFPKPIVAVMDGITMGGGVGLSINCPFRIATEKTVFAMPETLIGFFPDVGATYFLPRLDGQLGIYLGLTGHQLKAYDTVWAGIATHYIPGERLQALESRLAEVSSHDFSKVNAILNEFENGPPKGYHFTINPEMQSAIDRIFAYNDMKAIMLGLTREAQSNGPLSEWAQSTIGVLEARSPTSLHVSLAAMRETIDQTRYHTFQREYELASKFMMQPDLVEGITARLIERREPKWSLGPETLKTDGQDIIKKGRFNETLDESFYMLEEGRRDTVTAERGLFKYSLPMEASVLATLMRGKMDGSFDDKARFTRKELVEYVVGENLGRAGLERKLNHILDMRTIEGDNGKVIWKFDDATRM